MAGRQPPAPLAPYVVPTDGNEEICGGCGKGGELLCCDACPAAFHALCTGYSCLEEVPDGDEWLCWACSLQQGKAFLHSQMPLECSVGDQLMVASASAKASVWPGKAANPGEVFLRAAVTGVEGVAVHVQYLPPKQGTERMSRLSERLWHGTNDTELCWTPAPGGAFSPNARAFAIDTARLEAHQRSTAATPGQQQAGALAPAQQQPAGMLPRLPAAGSAVQRPAPVPAQPVALHAAAPSGPHARQAPAAAQLPAAAAQPAAQPAPAAAAAPARAGRSPHANGVSGASPVADATGGQATLAEAAPRGRPRGRPKKAGPAFKAEPWMMPSPHAWTHAYQPAADAVRLPAAKRRRLEAHAGAGGAAGAAGGAATPALLRHGSSASASPTVAEEAALLPGPGRTPGAAAVPSPAQPADPGLAAEELAGPVVRSGAADALAPDDAVEVRSLAVGMRGAWLPATVLQVGSGSVAEGGRTFLVEYRDWVRSQPPPEAATPLPAAATPGGSGLAIDTSPASATDAAHEAAAAALQERSMPDARLATGAKVQEWVPLVSRATTKAFPLVRLRQPRGPVPTDEAGKLAPGNAVEAWCDGGWVMGRLTGAAEALLVEVDAPPDGEGGMLEVPKLDVLRRAHPAAASGFGMVGSLEADHMLPRERYRRWLRPKTYRSQGFPFESYACAEALPSHRHIPSAAAGDSLPAGLDASSPATSAATSDDEGRSVKRRRTGSGSGATSPLRPAFSALGPSRLGNASGAGSGQTLLHRTPDRSPATSPAAAAALSAPNDITLPRPAGPGAAPSMGGLPASAVAAGAAGGDDADDVDLDIGHEGPALGPAGTLLKLEALPAAGSAGGSDAAGRAGQGPAPLVQPAAGLPTAAAGGNGRDGGGRVSFGNGGLSSGRATRQGSRSRSRSTSAQPSLSTHGPMEGGGHGQPIMQQGPPAAAAPAAAAAEDSSDVWLGPSSDSEGADDDSSDPEVDAAALSDSSSSEEEDLSNYEDEEESPLPPKRKRVPAAGATPAGRKQQQKRQPPQQQLPWVPPPAPPPQPPPSTGKLALY